MKPKHPSFKDVQEWVGDGALEYLGGVVLVEMYPNLPTVFLMKRLKILTVNDFIGNYAKRRYKMPYAPNWMERTIAATASSSINVAKELIRDMIKNCNGIQRADAEQLDQDGNLKDEVWNAYRERQRVRQLAGDAYKNFRLTGLALTGLLPLEKIRYLFANRVHGKKSAH